MSRSRRLLLPVPPRRRLHHHRAVRAEARPVHLPPAALPTIEEEEREAENIAPLLPLRRRGALPKSLAVEEKVPLQREVNRIIEVMMNDLTRVVVAVEVKARADK